MNDMWRTFVGMFRKEEHELEDPGKSVGPLASPRNIGIIKSTSMHPPNAGYRSALGGKSREIEFSEKEDKKKLALGSSTYIPVRSAVIPSTSNDDKPDYIKKVEFWQIRNRAAFAKRKTNVRQKGDIHRNPILCVKKWIGKDIIYEYSKKARQIEEEYAIPKGSKHYFCVEKPNFGNENEESEMVSSKRPARPCDTENAKRFKQF